MLLRKARWTAVTLLIASLALAQESEVVRDPREDWDVAKVRAELGELSVGVEMECSKSVIAGGWADKEPDIASLHGGRLSPYDGLCFPNFHYVDIEHIVARKEADESGMCDRPIEEREEFAADLLNLTFAPGSLNASKGKLDAGEISAAEQSLFNDELTAEGRCFWAAQTVRVKSKYGMSVDRQERNALDAILLNCETEQTSVARPVAPVECEWAVRPEFAATVAGTDNEPTAYCADRLEEESWRAAQQHAGEIICIAGANPRADQIAAQTACKAELESITCTAIRDHCPSVGPIQRGEPLYQAVGTNGRSNDADDDGIYCEDL